METQENKTGTSNNSTLFKLNCLVENSESLQDFNGIETFMSNLFGLVRILLELCLLSFLDLEEITCYT